jgi:pimeloyl-ACP methyl ester carboxylesterase
MGATWLRESTSNTAVVFIHGILSSDKKCWAAKGRPSWPDLLAAEPSLANIGILVVSYESGVGSGNYTISDAADTLREYLSVRDVLKPYQHVVFVGHSMGGIVARAFLVAEQASIRENHIRIGLFLVASPSLGSRWANTFSLLTHLFRNRQGQTLRFTDKNVVLVDLDKRFKDLKESGALELDGKELVEARGGLFGLLPPIVRRYSAARYFGREVKIAGTTHTSITKPWGREALQHEILVKFLKDTINLPNRSEHDTQQAITLVERLRGLEQHQGLGNHADALTAVRDALHATRTYLAARRGGDNRSNDTENKLSMLWNNAGNKIWAFDHDLGNLCMVKGHGWADETIWNKPQYRDLPLALDDILDYLLKTTRTMARHG